MSHFDFGTSRQASLSLCQWLPPPPLASLLSQLISYLAHVGVDCPDLVIPIQLDPQDLPYSLQVFGGYSFPSVLFMFLFC